MIDRLREEERLYELAEADPGMSVKELIHLANTEGIGTTYKRAGEILDQVREAKAKKFEV